MRVVHKKLPVFLYEGRGAGRLAGFSKLKSLDVDNAVLKTGK